MQRKHTFLKIILSERKFRLRKKKKKLQVKRIYQRKNPQSSTHPSLSPELIIRSLKSKLTKPKSKTILLKCSKSKFVHPHYSTKEASHLVLTHHQMEKNNSGIVT